MALYYISHPSVEQKASVEAPSTDKARTTFLDWLERQNLIRRGDRQLIREGLMTKRLKDGETFPVDVELSYDFEDAGEYRYRPQTFVEEEEPIRESYMETVSGKEDGTSSPAEPVPAVPSWPVQKGISPIAERALRGFV
jgi:hypothetical protein